MSKNEKAAVSAAAAKTNIERIESYQQSFGESREKLKETVGRLLLRLSAGQAEPDDWLLFERMLRLRWQEVERC